MLPSDPLRPITDDEVATFWRDGVVCLRGVMPSEWLAFMAGPVEASLTTRATTNLSAFGDDLATHAGAERLVDDSVAAKAIPRGHFLAGTDHWREQVEFLDFARHSPLGPIVARLLGSELARRRRFGGSPLDRLPDRFLRIRLHRGGLHSGRFLCRRQLTVWRFAA